MVDGPAEIVPERGFYNVHKKKKKKKQNERRETRFSISPKVFPNLFPVDFDGFKFRHELNFKLFKSFANSLSEKKSSIFSTRKKRNGTRSIKKGKKSPDDKIESNAFKTWQRSIKTQINYDLFPSPTFSRPESRCRRGKKKRKRERFAPFYLFFRDRCHMREENECVEGKSQY